ncbi:MAG: hypothetical protein AB7O97_12030 [Planctomycetota bacterium]
MKRFLLLMLAATALLGAFSPGLVAQGGSATERQQLAETRFRELTESMERLHAYLTRVGNEDEVKVLRAGMTLAQERKIQDAMGRVRLLLDNQRWDDAVELMQTVRADLVQLLEVLQNRNTDLQKVLEQIAALQAMRDEVDKLAKEQAAEKADSARTEALQEQLEAIAKARESAEQLLAEQQRLRARTNDLGIRAAPEATAPLAQQEGELQERTDDLAKELEDIEKTADELAEPKGDAEAGDAAPKEPNEGGAPKAASDSGSGSGAAKGAAKSMQKAGEQLGQNKPEPALKDQDQAIEQLKATLRELDQMADEARRELDKLPFDLQAQRQLETQRKTDALAQKMEKAEQDGEFGEGKPAPGRKPVQQAVPKQKAAAGQLKEYKPAKQDQQDAKEDLEQARDELDEAINQLRQQLQDEVLRALEERFIAMLQKQRELSLQTKTLDKTREQIMTADNALPAALRERIQAVAAGEQDLEVEAGDALKLLEEEGTTTVFPDIVAVLKDQLHDVARRCRSDETGKVVQQKQAEVEDTLGLLINALRRTIEDREGGQPGQCNGQPPLVPISAELKMIKFLQERVNARTKDYDEGMPAELRDTDAARAEALELSERQGRVRDLTRKLATKLNQENHAEDGR